MLTFSLEPFSAAWSVQAAAAKIPAKVNTLANI
jgi:hypothetical protein